MRGAGSEKVRTTMADYLSASEWKKKMKSLGAGDEGLTAALEAYGKAKGEEGDAGEGGWDRGKGEEEAGEAEGSGGISRPDG